MKKITTILLIALMMLLTACGGGGGGTNGGTTGKTITDIKEIEEVVREFYSVLDETDSYKLTTYTNDELISVLTKDQDKMHMEIGEGDYGYDYYLFIEDGKKYVVSEEAFIYEDEFEYDFAADTISMMLEYGVFSYLGTEEEGTTYTATVNGDNELVFHVEGEYEGEKVDNTVTGKKENGQMSEIISEINYGEESYITRYEFSYGETVELPEYSIPVSYDGLPHTDSPYKTYGEIMDTFGEDEYLDYYMLDEQLIVIEGKDGRYYQFSTPISEELKEQFGELDYTRDDYGEQLYNLAADIEIKDCIDFTEVIMPQDERDAYIGRKVQDMVDEGFEIRGFNFWGDYNSVYVMKDYLEYEAAVELPEGFDPDGEFEYGDLGVAEVKAVEFSSVDFLALPMK